MITRLLLVAMLFNSVQAVEFLKENTPSPKDGYLFSKEEEQKLRLDFERIDSKVLKLEDLGKINEQIIKEQQTYIKASSSAVNSGWLWFALGVVATGLGAYVGSKAVK